jgi:hypothetical protein
LFPCSPDVTSGTVAWHAIHTLLCLLGISNQSGFHQCPTECMFSLEDGSETEMVPDAPELLRNAHNIRDDDSALVYCVLNWDNFLPTVLLWSQQIPLDTH